MDFFVSHAGSDRAWAEWVAWHLREAGYTVELDAWDWAAGDNFVTRMHAAVDAASRVVALLSSAYFADGRYTAHEWSSALVKDEAGGHRLVPGADRAVPASSYHGCCAGYCEWSCSTWTSRRRCSGCTRLLAAPQPPDGAWTRPGVVGQRGDDQPGLRPVRGAGR
jgi:hypothetical protein